MLTPLCRVCDFSHPSPIQQRSLLESGKPFHLHHRALSIEWLLCEYKPIVLLLPVKVTLHASYNVLQVIEITLDESQLYYVVFSSFITLLRISIRL